MSTVERYLELVDTLRESRRSPTWKAEDDRPQLARLQDLYAKLSDIEREQVEAQGWRGWPHEYDARSATLDRGKTDHKG